MAKVQTTEGSTLKQFVGEGANKRELTEEEAEARCKEANRKAEELGIQARYEVAV
jgi:hypothetical protein